MPLHLHREIEKLKRRILDVGALVEEAVARAVAALIERDGEMARQVIDDDAKIDQREVEVEEECLKILALHQPVAIDLRFVVAVLKMNNDLERMGDLASNIAKRARSLANHDPVEMPADIQEMASRARSMIKRSLDAVVNADADLARRVCADDDELDRMRRTMQQWIMAQVERKPDQAEQLITLSSVPRHLERLGDMATNVAEDVIYMVEGNIIRHAGRNHDADH